jgi:hypothetical protein
MNQKVLGSGQPGKHTHTQIGVSAGIHLSTQRAVLLNERYLKNRYLYYLPLIRFFIT